MQPIRHKGIMAGVFQNAPFATDHQNAPRKYDSRPCSAVTRAQETLEKARAEVAGLNSIEAVKPKLYRPRQLDAGAQFTSKMGGGREYRESPGFKLDEMLQNRKREQKMVYRLELEKQIEQTRNRRIAERQRELDGMDHPLGPSYGNHESQRIAIMQRNLSPQIRKDSFSYRMPESLENIMSKANNDAYSRSNFSSSNQLRQMPPTTKSNPEPDLAVPVDQGRGDGQHMYKTMNGANEAEKTPSPISENERMPRKPQYLAEQKYYKNPEQVVQSAQPNPMPRQQWPTMMSQVPQYFQQPQMGVVMGPQVAQFPYAIPSYGYPSQVWMGNPYINQPVPLQAPAYSNMQNQGVPPEGVCQQMDPPLKNMTTPYRNENIMRSEKVNVAEPPVDNCIDNGSSKLPNNDRANPSGIDLDELKTQVLGKQRIWQTSEELPDSNLKEAIHRAELRLQIQEARKRREQRLAKEKMEEEKLEQKIFEYNAQRPQYKMPEDVARFVEEEKKVNERANWQPSLSTPQHYNPNDSKRSSMYNPTTSRQAHPIISQSHNQSISPSQPNPALLAQSTIYKEANTPDSNIGVYHTEQPSRIMQLAASQKVLPTESLPRREMEGNSYEMQNIGYFPHQDYTFRQEKAPENNSMTNPFLSKLNNKLQKERQIIHNYKLS